MSEEEILKKQWKERENLKPTKFYSEDYVKELQKRIDKAIEYINEYAWQEDIIGDMWTTTGEPVKDRYMRLEWDNCNELLEDLIKADMVEKVEE